MQRHLVRLGCLAVAVGLASAPSTVTQAHSSSFLDSLPTAPSLSASTLATNCDTNPYGVAIVPQGFPGGGQLRRGDILVSNFNNGTSTGSPPVCTGTGGLQGTGTTIVRVREVHGDPHGETTTFFTADPSTGPVGLTTALVVLRAGLVVVGNAPLLNGDTVADGGLTFLDGDGNVVSTLTDNTLLQGPWDMTADESDPDDPILYVSNVLSGTVTRIELRVETGPNGPSPDIQSLTKVASGFKVGPNASALVVGPTGVLLSHDGDDLYVADTANNSIQLVKGVREARRDRGHGTTVLSGGFLNGPLGLAWTPRNTIVASNGDAIIPADNMPPPPTPNLVIEFNPRNGDVLTTRQLDDGAAGALFGILIAPVRGKTSLVYVDDNDNTVNVLPSTH